MTLAVDVVASVSACCFLTLYATMYLSLVPIGSTNPEKLAKRFY
jgi:hypothetical protein